MYITCLAVFPGFSDMRSYELLPLVTLFAPQTLARVEMPRVRPGSGAAPRTLLLRGEEIAALRQSLPGAAGPLKEGYEELVRRAESALAEPLFTPTGKTVLPEGAEPRDYVSFAKYWHPDSSAADGLPYVQRDGEVNPDIYDEDKTDVVRFERFSDVVFLLSFAFALTDDARFGERAAEQLRSWFVSEETSQTPHFRFAQMVRGRKQGRFIGLIEARRYVYLLDAEALLAGTPFWSEADRKAFRKWFERFFNWLRTGRYGQRAVEKDNNIGMWYDAQSAIYALYLGETELAEKIVRDSVANRVPQQIEADGAMPNELDRARPYDYVAFNLLAMMALGRAGDAVGFDAWWSEDEDGRSFKRAMDWMLAVLGSEDASGALDLSAEAARLRKENSELAARVETLTRQKAALSADQDGLKRTSKEQAGTIEALRTQLAAERETALAEQEKRIAVEARARRVPELEEERDYLSGKLARLNARLEAASHLEADLKSVRQELAGAQQQLKAARASNQELAAARDALNAQLAERAQEAEAIRQSTSWKVTAPIRAASRLIRR